MILYLSYKILFLIYYSFSLEKPIKNYVYNLIYKNLYFNYENDTIQISELLKEQINSYFRIKKVSKNIDYYYIEHINTELKLIYSDYNKLNVSINLLGFDSDFDKWCFIQNGDNTYKIQNKNKCFIKVKEFIITCEYISFEEASEFNLIKIYEEANENILNNKIIENEAIDILIKYIDLRDPSLKRDGIHQIRKDFDNEELRYSIRSILKNIPWVRKIFIVMPNEKVRYFKSLDIIKDKIIYIKDKNILGYDSSNSLGFQFRYWKMKKYGISDNFIVMDDDCFIGKPLKKKDFFYIINGKVTPLIISNLFLEINNNYIQKKLEEYKAIISKTIQEQTSISFKYSLYLTYTFLIKLFNQSKFFPIHTHNAIPVNIKEIKEIYDLVYQSEYRSTTLDSLYRQNSNIQFQAFILAYTFIKYNKKVKNIPSKLIQNKNSITEDYNFSLFCINTGAINYTKLSFMKSKILMEYLYPISTPYEIVNLSLPLLTYNTVYLIQKEFIIYKVKKKDYINKLENQLYLYKKKINYNYFIINIIVIFYIFYFKINNKQ